MLPSICCHQENYHRIIYNLISEVVETKFADPVSISENIKNFEMRHKLRKTIDKAVLQLLNMEKHKWKHRLFRLLDNFISG